MSSSIQRKVIADIPPLNLDGVDSTGELDQTVNRVFLQRLRTNETETRSFRLAEPNNRYTEGRQWRSNLLQNIDNTNDSPG